MSEFVTLYPGASTPREKPLVEKYLAENRALADRGQIDVKALVSGKLPKDTPGVGPSFVASEAMIRYNNAKYDPENPVLNDAAYARKLGYQDILAYPTFGAYDDAYIYPYPHAARDKMVVSNLNHSVVNYKPVYPGDRLFLVVNARHFVDLTPPVGSDYRSAALQFEGSIYNQKGEKTNDVIFRATENIKIYKEGRGPQNPTPFDAADAPDWKRRPAHYYTDDDWDYIKDLWSKEKRQGAVPLYWEDVKIGDEPIWTVDGPIEQSLTPIPPWGMGLGGSRTIKKEIMDPRVFKTMIRGEKDGIYRLPDKTAYIPPVPDDPATVKRSPFAGPASTDTRSILINYLGRDLAIRHINNWMGDRGWILFIGWGIMPPETHAAFGKVLPANPLAGHYLQLIPKMKGRYVMAHGLTGDLAIVKSQVYDKYVRDGEFFVELGWWIESIEGYIWEEGGATVKLPSKNAK